MSRRVRILLLFFLAGVGSFVAGTQFLASRQAQAQLAHPLTGRVIAGIATDQRWLDRTERASEELPDRALQLIGITPGLSVADVGAGTGYMTLRIARTVGPAGKVYANDVQPAMLQTIESRLRQERVENVQVVQGAEDDVRLPANSVDLVLMVDVYHELRQPQSILRSIRRSLRPEGRLVLVEYRKEDPRIPIAETHKMSVAQLRAEVEPEGFALDHLIEELPRQHIAVFRKSGV